MVEGGDNFKIMKINNISSIDNLGDSINVMVNVKFESDYASRWELTEPKVSVTYTKDDGRYTNYMELLDRGMNVHGFELSENEQKEVLDFLEKNNIPN